jgi:CheY-like chemotaxis protein
MVAMVTPTSAPRSGGSVVVVDDDEDTVASLRELLGEEGYRVETFTDPLLALNRIRGGPEPDVIIVDCLMPGLSGPEFVTRLGAAGVRSPVVMVTALTASAAFGGRGTVTSVLRKPFEVEELFCQLRAAISSVSR